jgi:hypothetical protein
VGTVEHVLADDRSDVFHGLIVDSGDHGHRFARAALVDGLFERGVIVAVPAAELPEPSADPAAHQVEQEQRHLLSKAWEWLKQPK